VEAGYEQAFLLNVTLNRGRVTVTFGAPLRFRYEEPAEIVEMTRKAVEEL